MRPITWVFIGLLVASMLALCGMTLADAFTDYSPSQRVVVPLLVACMLLGLSSLVSLTTEGGE